MLTKEVIERAAEILLREARFTRESCQLNGCDWACKGCDPGKCARRDHDEMIEIAVKLRGVEA